MDDKYYKTIRYFYKLKSDYEKKHANMVKSVKELEISNKEKAYRVRINKQKLPCVNCKRNVSTIFKTDNNMLIAKCGSETEPCGLNINIQKATYINLEDSLKDSENFLNYNKLQIIINKLDLLFNYKNEDKAIEEFEQQKINLKESMEEYNDMFDSVTNISHPNLKLLDDKIIQRRQLIEKLTNNVKLYKQTMDTPNSIQLIKDTVAEYKSLLLPLNNEINELKYNKMKVINKYINDDGKTYLIQKKYDDSDMLEILDSYDIKSCLIGHPNNKVVNCP